jgi:hypothetical protein
VRRVYDLGSTSSVAGEQALTVKGSTGLLRDPSGHPVHAAYVLADPSLQIVGTRVADDPDKGMAVYRVDGLLRTSTSIGGWYGDTWTGPHVTWARRSCTAGRLSVPVHSSPELFGGVVQHIRVSGSTAPLTVALRSTERKTIVVPLRPTAGVCRIRIDITPVRKPAGDPRTLGVLIDGFRYEPSG